MDKPYDRWADEDGDHCECEYCSHEGDKEKCWALKRINELKEKLNSLQGDGE